MLHDDDIAGHCHIGTKPKSLYGFGGTARRKGASSPFGQVEKMCIVTQNLPTLWNLGPFQVVEGIPNIKALTLLPLGIGGFRLKLSLRSNTRCIGHGCIGCWVEYQAYDQFLPWSSK